jgi:hypothetical protein
LRGKARKFGVRICMNFKLFGDLIVSISDYDKSGPFSIGFRIFLLGFALVFLVIFNPRSGFNNEYCPLSSASNAKRILVIGLVIAISGLIISIASV